MRDIVKAFRRPPTGRMGDRNGGLPRLSDSVADASRCAASPRRTLLAENLGKPSLGVIITVPWYKGMAEEPTTKENLPPGAEIDSDGLWSQVLNRAQGATRRAALFLDRDGVVVEDVHYLHRPADVRLIDGAAGVIAEANRRAIPVVMVTNQAGIAHGHYGWAEFIQVQEKILDDLAAEGAFVNGIFACPHHGGGRAPYDVGNHPWRKPNPGMLLAAAERLPLDLGQSWIIGDRADDLEAGKNAALAGGLHVLSGHGDDDGERDSALALAGARFQTLAASTIAGAIFQLPLFQSVVDGAP